MQKKKNPLVCSVGVTYQFTLYNSPEESTYLLVAARWILGDCVFTLWLVCARRLLVFFLKKTKISFFTVQMCTAHVRSANLK